MNVCDRESPFARIERLTMEITSSNIEAMHSGLNRGSMWALASHGGSQVLRLGGNLILWRLLYPEAFGLMALVNVFMQGLAMFSDVGIAPSIIQSERGDDPDYLNTAWTIQVLRGFILCAVAFVTAVPLAHFYHEPQLSFLIPIVAMGAVVAGFNSTRLVTATRHIYLGRLTILDLSSQIFGLAAMIGLCAIYRSVWALAVGGLVSAAIRAVLSHTFMAGIKNRLRWDRSSAHALLRFGRWIFISTLLGFAVMQSDRLIFGKLIPMSLLGVYSIALVWSSFPISILERIFNSVLFPLLSRLYREGGDFSATFISIRRPWLFLIGWASACLIGGGPTLIHLMYDQRAAAGGWMIQVLACSTWLLALETANSTALLAMGKPSWVAAGSGAKLAGMLILIPLGMINYGFPGALVGFAGSEFIRYLVSVIGARTMKISGLLQDMLLSALVMATASIGLACEIRFASFLTMLPFHQPRILAFFNLVCLAFVVGLGWGGCYAVQWLVQKRNARA